MDAIETAHAELTEALSRFGFTYCLTLELRGERLSLRTKASDLIDKTYTADEASVLIAQIKGADDPFDAMRAIEES